MPKFPVTVHTIVKNEDKFIYFALKSVIPFVEKILIYDTGSTDDTWSIINILKKEFDSQIETKQIKIKSPHEISKLRHQQIKETATPFFLLLDGDEIWPEGELQKLLSITANFPKNKIAVVNQTRNCVGDIYHYLPEKFGKYSLLGKIGHLNLRLLKTLPYQIKGIYPDEAYYLDNMLINSLDDKLIFSDAWYLHTTHLKRSSNRNKPFGRRKEIISKGIKFSQSEIPELLLNNPVNFEKRSILFELKAQIFDFLRQIR